MKKKPLVVLDTNVLVSASSRKKPSIPDAIYEALKAQRFTLITSVPILKEVRDVINRTEIIAFTKTTPDERKQFIVALMDISVITPGKQLSVPAGRDITDDKILACGREGQADYIVTGDRDLLVIEEFEDIKIITPRAFLEKLNEK
jgi:uncharacterized protein